MLQHRGANLHIFTVNFVMLVGAGPLYEWSGELQALWYELPSGEQVPPDGKGFVPRAIDVGAGTMPTLARRRRLAGTYDHVADNSAHIFHALHPRRKLQQVCLPLPTLGGMWCCCFGEVILF